MIKKNRVKKGLVLALIMVSSAFCLTACGKDKKTSGSGSGGGNTVTTEAKSVGIPKDTGIIKVLVPDGWKAFDVKDMWAEEENALDPKQLQIYKGAETETDMFGKCGMNINYYPPGTTFVSAKSFYDDVKDIDSFEKAGYSWSGYTCSSAGYEYTILEGNKGEEDLQVSIITKAGDNTMSIDDEDVQSILDSIETTPPAK